MFLTILGFFSGIIGCMGMGGGTILIPALILFAHIDPKIAQSVKFTFLYTYDYICFNNTYKK